MKRLTTLIYFLAPLALTALAFLEPLLAAYRAGVL